MSKEWIQSVSGLTVFPRALKPEQVREADIFAALSKKPRFSGQTNGTLGYSVAQHCVTGSRQFGDPKLSLAFLLHEVSEVYLPDVPSPLKPHLWVVVDGGMISWASLETLHADAIFTALGLQSLRPLLSDPEIKRMDQAMLATEKRDLMGPEPAPWDLPEKPLVSVKKLMVWSASVAAGLFKQSYIEYRKALGL